MKKLRFFLTLVLGTAVLYGLTACGLSGLVYPGASSSMVDAGHGHSEQYVVWRAQDGTILRGWFFNRGAGTPLVAFYGGNAMNVGSFNNIAAADTTRSYLLINYRGYGGSEGEPSEEKLVSDARHCLAYAREQMGQPSSVALVGFSLGSGVAVQVAAAEKTDALVLICPFDNITNVACNMVPFLPRLLPLDTWKSSDFAPQITCPVRILRAEHDTIVPPDSTDKLIMAFTSTVPQVFNFNADHNNIFSAPQFTQTLMQQLP